jgi:hypothetical protein
MTLDPPTPLQWQTLEESVIIHQQYLKEQGGNETCRTTGVDAAPLVAVIDDVTGKGYVTWNDCILRATRDVLYVSALMNFVLQQHLWSVRDSGSRRGNFTVAKVVRRHTGHYGRDKLYGVFESDGNTTIAFQ